MSSLAELERFRVVAGAPNGVQRLRELVLQLAVQGKLVPQDPNDEPASELLKRIAAEKERLISEGKIKRQKPLPAITEEEKPFELPKGWEWVRLGNLGISGTGKTPSTHKTQYYGNELPFIGPGQITIEGTLLGADKYLSKLGRAETAIATQGDILMVCIGGSIGKAVIAPYEVAFNQQINVISPLLVNSKFLYFVLMSICFQKMILQGATGSATPIINRSKWESILVPLAPVSEQTQIELKVNSLLALCDQLEVLQSQQSTLQASTWQEVLNAITQASSTLDLTKAWQRLEQQLALLVTEPEQVKGLRDTILQLAVQGKLVPQDPNDEPASVLLTKIQAEKERLIKAGKIKRQKPLPPITDEEKPFELPKGWEWVRLGDLCLKITDGTHHSPANFASGDFMYVTAKNIKQSGVILDDITFVSTDVHQEIYNRCNPEYGDILYIKDGATTGVVTINNIKEPFSMLSSVALIKLPSLLINKYLVSIMRSPFFYETMRAEMSGVAITRVTLKKLYDAVIPLAPFKQQNTIIEKLANLHDLCDQLEARLQAARQTQAQFALETVNNLSTQ